MGFVKTRSITTLSLGLLAVIFIEPSPTSLLPDHENFAPTPEAGPSKEFFAFGSSFAHGDQSLHL